MADRPDPWNEDSYPLAQAMKGFSDEDLAEMGVSRDDDRETIIAKIKDEAVRQWSDQEEAIEESVKQAQLCIDMYPTQRDQALARFYGEAMQDIAGEEVDGEAILMTMMMTIFKLAEERNHAAWLMDGNRRYTP